VNNRSRRLVRRAGHHPQRGPRHHRAAFRRRPGPQLPADRENLAAPGLLRGEPGGGPMLLRGLDTPCCRRRC